MPFFSSLKRLHSLCAGVCVAFSSIATVALAETEADITTEHESIVKFIQSLPPAPNKTISQQIKNLPERIEPPTIEPPVPVQPTINPSFATTPNESLRAAVTRMNLPLPLPNARIVVSKAQRTLELFSGEKLVKTYYVALGSNPNGHKQYQNDGRTPEGQFYICTRNAKTSDFHIFLGLSYPALPDATRGVNQKIITWRDYQIIRQRLASRGAPLWETRLGGWVGIHGGSDGAFAARKKRERGASDWTAGCVALTDKEISEIHAATIMGTPVLIRP